MIENTGQPVVTPIEKLVELAQLARTYAKPLPTQFEMGDFWSGVGFSLAGVRFVAPIEQISEMMKVPQFSFIPGVQPWVKGVANVRGHLVPIFDLSACLGLQTNECTTKSRILIIQQDEWSAGLIVDAVSGMQHFPVELHEQAVHDAPEPLETFTRGQYVRDNKQWIVLSLLDICMSDQFKELAL